MTGFVLHLRDQEVGGAVTSGRLYRVAGDAELDWDHRLPEFTLATRGQRLIVLLHGYNNSLSAGRTSLVRFIALLEAGGSTDPMLAVLWPGDGHAKTLTYPFEGRDADDSAEALVRWLSANAGDGARVALVGHSLGCRVAMRAAQLLARRGAPAVDRVCLMAPAIDNDSLGAGSAYRDATLAADRVAVLASEQDRVLRYAFPLGDLAQTVLFSESWSAALGRTGPREADSEIRAKLEPVPLADPARAIDHGHYLAVDPANPGRTIAETEAFVLDFLARAARPRWPAQRP
jgi:pimeloyl-ACP methyl ester carboxylesterase